MRILLTADPMIPVPPVGYGGIERIVDALIRHFRAAGHEVGLLAHPASTARADMRMDWPDLRIKGATATFRNALALHRAVRTFRPEVLHSFSRLAYLLPLLPSRLPKLMSYQRHTGGRQIALAARIGGRALRFSGCSEFICRLGRPHGGAWSAIPNFVELDRLTFVSRVPDDAPLVFLSRVESMKGPELAIAIARAAGRRLIIAGNHAERGPQRQFWDQQIHPHLGHDGVEWIGEVDDMRKSEVLGRAAALLVPIQWDEPFGIVFPEALACGTPVITCARGALPEIIEDGRTGYFIRNVTEGVTAIRRLSAIDRSICRRVATERFSLPVVANEYLRLYSRMLSP